MLKRMHGMVGVLAIALACVASATGCGGGDEGAGGKGNGGGPPAAPNCTDYCNIIMGNCTMGNAQYSGMDQCVASCKAFKVGTAMDTSGNTLGCRQYHAGAAAGDPNTHCPHAGPGGDGMCG